MKALAVFVIVWKTWKKQRILRFSTTKEAWQYIDKYKINSYSIYWATESLEHSQSTVSIREHIEKLVRENPEVLVGWTPSTASCSRSVAMTDETKPIVEGKQ